MIIDALWVEEGIVTLATRVRPGEYKYLEIPLEDFDLFCYENNLVLDICGVRYGGNN